MFQFDVFCLQFLSKHLLIALAKTLHMSKLVEHLKMLMQEMLQSQHGKSVMLKQKVKDISIFILNDLTVHHYNKTQNLHKRRHMETARKTKRIIFCEKKRDQPGRKEHEDSAILC